MAPRAPAGIGEGHRTEVAAGLRVLRHLHRQPRLRGLKGREAHLVDSLEHLRDDRVDLRVPAGALRPVAGPAEFPAVGGDHGAGARAEVGDAGAQPARLLQREHAEGGGLILAGRGDQADAARDLLPRGPVAVGDCVGGRGREAHPLALRE